MQTLSVRFFHVGKRDLPHFSPNNSFQLLYVSQRPEDIEFQRVNRAHLDKTDIPFRGARFTNGRREFSTFLSRWKQDREKNGRGDNVSALCPLPPSPSIFLSSCNRHLTEKIKLLSRRIETSLEKSASSNYYLSLQHLDETV